MTETRADFNGKNYDDRFVGDLVTFVAGDKFQKMFESFFIENAMEFTNVEEHKLEWYAIYQRFHDLFEEQLQEFCDAKGMTQGEFMMRCREASTEDSKAKHYISILLSSVEYDTFVKLMRIMRPVAERRLAAAALIAAAAAKAEAKVDAPDVKGAAAEVSEGEASKAVDAGDKVAADVDGGEKASAKGEEPVGAASKGVDDDEGLDAKSDAKSAAVDEDFVDTKGAK